MKDINTPMVEVSESKPSVNEVQPEVKGSNPKRKSNILVLILVFIIFLLVGVIAYLFLTNKVELAFLDDDSTDNKVEENLDDTTKNEDSDEDVIETKEYYNSAQGVKFKYPSDWKVEEETTGEDGFFVSFSENKSNPDFVFEFDLPSVSGYEACYFSDTDNPAEGMGAFYTNYTTIDKNDTFRRTFTTMGEIESYTICKKSSGTYFNWVDSGYVSYKVKMSRSDSEKMIKLMDEILLSFEYTGDIGN